MADSQLVSVVIPAYNAAATLDETLHSVRSQTHRALEIIVVDDGSTDNTRMVAERHAAVDHRIQLLTHEENAGVAAARNTGWQHARSELIAFIDADDLWANTKIERQVQAVLASSEQVGLVYCWSVRINSLSEIIGHQNRARWGGDVLSRILSSNFIGNGSVVLVRREALIFANGFDSRLRNSCAEGCEDLLAYYRIAQRYHFVVVPEPLVGYRYLPNTMSSNRPSMLRSWLLVSEEMIAQHPEHSHALKSGFRAYCSWIVRDVLWNNEWKQLPSMLLSLLRSTPTLAMEMLLKDIPITLTVMVHSRLLRLYRKPVNPTEAETGQRFLIGDLDQCQ
jgi:glycosyltransferase involved in cell wall biosynthesis